MDEDPGILHVSSIRCDKELISIFKGTLFRKGISQAEFFRYILHLFMVNDHLSEKLIEGACAFAAKERAKPTAILAGKLPKRLSQTALYVIFERARKEKKENDKRHSEDSGEGSSGDSP
jgi:hypothetical protein